MADRVLILGAGFGGLELASALAEARGSELEVTLIDRAEGFAFGYSKLELMFGRARIEELVIPYSRIVKPGVRFRRETVTGIDPEARRVVTDAGEYEADALVIALGADLDVGATPGLAEGGHEFYSFAGAERCAPQIAAFERGQAVIGVCGAPIKCPPAPCEGALLLDDELRSRGVRDACRITVATPFGRPVPPSAETSAALLDEFEQRGIEFLGGVAVAALDPERGVAILADGSELAYDLFLGVPRHRAPAVVAEAGLTEEGYVPVDPGTLETRFPGVYAVGDVATVGVPKAGVFAEGAARTVAAALAHRFLGAPEPERFVGHGTCYIEFGEGRVGGVEIDFLSGPEPNGTFHRPSAAMAADKEEFGAARRARWFG